MDEKCPKCEKFLPDNEKICQDCHESSDVLYKCPECNSILNHQNTTCFNCGFFVKDFCICWNCGLSVSTDSSFCSHCGMLQPDFNELSDLFIKKQSTNKNVKSGEFKTQNFESDSNYEVLSQDEVNKHATLTFTQELKKLKVDGDRLKIITILFADISGFTQMSEKLHPEEVKDIVNECFVGLTRIIKSGGGVIDKYIGDCIMALFGIPQSLEDDPDRAVDTAFAMHRFIKKYSNKVADKVGTNLQMRIGINTGQVLAGYVGDAKDKAYTVMGDAVNVASRLEHVCPEGSILVSYETYKLLSRRFLVAKGNPVSVKGKEKPLDVIEVIGQDPEYHNIAEPSFMGVKTNFIGRNKELKLLNISYENFKTNTGCIIVAVKSILGMGKSRLVNEFLYRRINKNEAIEINRMQCRNYLTDSAYAPFTELLCRLSDINQDDNQNTIISKCSQYLSRFTDDKKIKEHASFAAAHVIQGFLKNNKEVDAISEIPQQLDNYIREGLLSFYKVKNEKNPLIIVIEDLHSASDTLLNFLENIAAFKKYPILIILIYRSESEKRIMNRFRWMDENLISISLKPLNDKLTREMVFDLLKKADDIPLEFVDKIVNTCKGYPLFIEEVLGNFCERGIIDIIGKRWKIDVNRVNDFELPQSVESTILSRVDALPVPCRDVLQVAAVVGVECWTGLIKELTAQSGNKSLDLLCKREFIAFRKDSRVPNENEFYFIVPAVQEVLQRHVLLKVKNKLHKKIAQWLELRIPRNNEELKRKLAFHYSESQQVDKALTYRSQVGFKSEKRGDLKRAEDDFNWVFEQVDKNRDLLKKNPDMFIKTQISIIRILRRTGRHIEAESVFKKVEKIINEEFKLIKGNILTGLCRVGNETVKSLILQKKNRPKSLKLLKTLLKKLDLKNESEIKTAGVLIKQKGWIEYLEGNYDSSLSFYNQGIRLLKSYENSQELSALYNGKGVCLGKMEQFTEAENLLRLSLTIFRKNSDFSGEASTLVNLGALRYRQKKYKDSIKYFDVAHSINERIGDIIEAAICQSNSGEIYILQENYPKALQKLECSYEVFSRTRSTDYLLMILPNIIECCYIIEDNNKEEKYIKDYLIISKKQNQKEDLLNALKLACRHADLTNNKKLLSKFKMEIEKLELGNL